MVKKGKGKLFQCFVDFKKAYDTVDRSILLERLQKLGINGILLKNIHSMYTRTFYSIKLKGGHTDPIASNLGLKQGCPLSPMLFNLYIDDIQDCFDQTCEPIQIHNKLFNYFLYADDLVIISKSKIGLQNGIDKVYDFSQSKHLTISDEKSKTMVFNSAGRLIKEIFTLKDKSLEPVQSFCYLGFDVKCSGIVTHAMNVLNDKGNKALRPLLGVIYRFNIPFKSAVKLFNTFISPILLYNTENWNIISDTFLKRLNTDNLFSWIIKSKVDTTHRKMLKNVLGVTKSCPDLAVYGETGEFPLSLKGLRLTLNFWNRVNSLPETSLAKKALLENITIRSNWIQTIEKLIGILNIADKIENPHKFNNSAKKSLRISIHKILEKFFE